MEFSNKLDIIEKVKSMQVQVDWAGDATLLWDGLKKTLNGACQPKGAGA